MQEKLQRLWPGPIILAVLVIVAFQFVHVPRYTQVPIAIGIGLVFFGGIEMFRRGKSN